jgi:hypothetical protein
MKFISSVILLLVFTSGSANAYLDPGTGSLILQGLIAGIMVVATTMGIYWQKFLDIVYQVTGKDFRKPSPQDEENEEEVRENES